jgi:hypothetical protein
MKILLAIAVGWVLLAPSPAAALNPGECAQLLKQIHHYKGMENRAVELGNEMWADRMQFQTDLLRERYDGRCDGFAEDDRLIRQAIADFAQVLKIAAKAAAKFFTAGAL